MEKVLCLGCMQEKEQRPVCEHCGFDERTGNHPHQLPVGTILQNQYLIGRVLGQGGFGITYAGWDNLLMVPVALPQRNGDPRQPPQHRGDLQRRKNPNLFRP